MQTQTSNTLHNAIMEASSKDRPPMLAPGNYVQWKSRIKRYIDTKPNHELINYCLENPSYKLDWKDIEVPISKGSPITTTARIYETYKNVSQEIRDQLNAEAKAVQIILTGIDNDIYSIVDACPNIKFTSQDGESLESYYSRFYKMMNELIRNQCKETYKNVLQDIHDQLNAEAEAVQIILTGIDSDIYSTVDACPNAYDETSKDKEIDKLMALISLSFKKIYKPTNNNLRTSLNTSRANQDNSLRMNRSAGYENQSIGNVAGARETVGSTVEFRHVTRECQKPKRAKDAAYHREKMLLCKQEEAGIQLNAEQADWRDDTDDDELEDQEKEAHYIAHSEQSKFVPDTYPIEQDAHNVIIDSLDMSYDREEINQNDDDNDLANEQAKLARRNSMEYAPQMEIECSKVRGDFLSNKMESQKSSNKYTQTINDLNQTISKIKDKLSAHQETISILSQQKEAQIKLYKTCKDKKLDKVIALENKVKVLDNIVYKTSQSVQTMNMLNNKCRTSFPKLEFLKKAQRANPLLSQQATTRNKGKAIINSAQPIYDEEPSMVAEDEETSKDKEIDKLMALISLSFKKIYKRTNNNLRTSSNTSRANQDNSPRINRSAGYENQRIEEAGIQLNAKQDDWRDDTDDDELEDQELEVHYMYMAQLQEVSLDTADSGPIFNDEPLQKVVGYSDRTIKPFSTF
nr:hypothetical protein [Tanacetum cinerariifolium]